MCKKILIAGIGIFLALSFFSITATAAEWSLEPEIKVEEEFTDNIFLNPDDEQSVWKTVISPKLDLSYRTEVFELKSTLRAAIKRYIDNSELDSDDQFYRLLSAYKKERHHWRLNFSYSKESTLRTELLDTGILGTTRQRELLVVRPSWSYNLTELTRVVASYQFRNQSFTTLGTDTSGLVATDTHGGTLSLIRTLSERTNIGSVLSYRNVVSQGGRESNNVDLRLRLNHAFSETLGGSFSGGARYTTVEQNNREGDDVGFLLGVNVGKSFELTRIGLSLKRDVFPSGLGTLRQRDEVILSMETDLTSLLTAGVSARYLKNKRIGDEDNREDNRFDRTFYEINSVVNWQWARDWFLNAGYSFRAQQFKGQSTAFGNVVFIGISYQIPKISVSR